MPHESKLLQLELRVQVQDKQKLRLEWQAEARPKKKKKCSIWECFKVDALEHQGSLIWGMRHRQRWFQLVWLDFRHLGIWRYHLNRWKKYGTRTAVCYINGTDERAPFGCLGTVLTWSFTKTPSCLTKWVWGLDTAEESLLLFLEPPLTQIASEKVFLLAPHIASSLQCGSSLCYFSKPACCLFRTQSLDRSWFVYDGKSQFWIQ